MTDVTIAVRPEPALAPPDRDWIAALPKVELHLHLSGSVRPATALRLARERGVAADASDAELVARLRAPDRCADQAELLEAFALPTALLQDREALEIVAAELVEDVAGDSTRYAEIRFGPANHVRGGLTLEDAVGAVAAGIARARTTLDDAPHVRLILIAMRTDPPTASRAVAELAASSGGIGVVGFDLAGLEATAPSVEPHRDAFEMARAAGLGTSVHAGEWGGAAQVREAWRLRPDRIAHGGPAVDDPALLAELRAAGATLDVCPTSNVQAGLVDAMADHPLPRLLAAGVRTTVSTDDRTVSATTLPRELALAMDPLGLDRDAIIGLQRSAIAAAFLGGAEDLRAGIASELRAFEDRQPDEGASDARTHP